MADKSKQADTSPTTSKDAPLKSAAELDERAALRKAETAQPPSETTDKLVDADLDASNDLLFSRYLQLLRRKSREQMPSNEPADD
jgi:hypothetical protein